MLRILLGYAAAVVGTALVITGLLHKRAFIDEFLSVVALEILFSILPFAACATIAHIYRIRSPAYYVAWAFVPILVLNLVFHAIPYVFAVTFLILPAALFDGFLYWMVAGYAAGRGEVR
ncbi:MAG: hypothetical protein JOY81_02525 [Alphaproteobacteria bacterium]|nr:hypothetical protein [Alphaproteobacteria bacterium]